MANNVIEITDSVSQEDSTSTASNQAPEQEQVDSSLPQSEELSAIPEKFVGKSGAEIAQSYVQLEKHVGKISSERAQEKKALEEAKARAEKLEQELQATRASYQQPAAATAQAPADSDPFKPFDETFDADPKTAIRSGLEKVREEARQETMRARMALMEQDQRTYYERQKQDNPEFAELEPEMTRIAQTYATLLRPEALRDRRVVDLMFNLAKGQNVSKIVQREIEKAKKSSELVRDEKKRAFSESSTSSQGDKGVAFEDMTSEQMKKYLSKIED